MVLKVRIINEGKEDFAYPMLEAEIKMQESYDLFNHLIYFMESSIDGNNAKIQKEVDGETYEIAISMLNQPHYYNSLYYYKDMVYKSLIMNIYSLLETSLKIVSEISSDQIKSIKQIKNIREFNKINGSNVSIIEKHINFLNSEVIPNKQVSDEFIDALKLFNKLRNSIAHYDSEIKPEYIVEITSIEGLKTILKDSNNYLYIENNKPIIYFLELVKRFIYALFNAIDQEYKLTTIR